MPSLAVGCQPIARMTDVCKSERLLDEFEVCKRLMFRDFHGDASEQGDSRVLMMRIRRTPTLMMLKTGTSEAGRRTKLGSFGCREATDDGLASCRCGRNVERFDRLFL